MLRFLLKFYFICKNEKNSKKSVRKFTLIRESSKNYFNKNIVRSIKKIKSNFFKRNYEIKQGPINLSHSRTIKDWIPRAIWASLWEEASTDGVSAAGCLHLVSSSLSLMSIYSGSPSASFSCALLLRLK